MLLLRSKVLPTNCCLSKNGFLMPKIVVSGENSASKASPVDLQRSGLDASPRRDFMFGFSCRQKGFYCGLCQKDSRAENQWETYFHLVYHRRWETENILWVDAIFNLLIYSYKSWFNNYQRSTWASCRSAEAGRRRCASIRVSLWKKSRPYQLKNLRYSSDKNGERSFVVNSRLFTFIHTI